MRRSANSTGYGAGCPSRVDAPGRSDQIERCQVFISSLVSIDSAFCITGVDRYSPPLRKNKMYSMSFLMIAPGW